MEYTPVTTGPITPDVLERVAVKVAEKYFFDDDFVYHVYVDYRDDWEDEGVRLLLEKGVSSKSEVADDIYEYQTHKGDYEFDVASQVVYDFDERLKQIVEEEGIDASFQDVMNQINDERANIESCVEFDWGEPIDHAWKGIEEFAEKVGLSVEELAKFADVLMPNSVPEDYVVFHNAKEFVDYVIDIGLDTEDLFDFMNDGQFDKDYYEEHGLDDKALGFLYGQSLEAMRDWARREFDVDLHDGAMLIYVG